MYKEYNISTLYANLNVQDMYKEYVEHYNNAAVLNGFKVNYAF